MDFITFKQFIYTINIRECYTNKYGKDIEDNRVIRLFYTEDGEYKKNNYIDIGWYDYFGKDSIWKILSDNLNQKILESKVTDFYWNDDYNCLEVYCQTKTYEDLQGYQN